MGLIEGGGGGGFDGDCDGCFYKCGSFSRRWVVVVVVVVVGLIVLGGGFDCFGWWVCFGWWFLLIRKLE